MKIISWNVNGIRAAIKKGFLDFVELADADILCLQEVRALPEQVDLDIPGYTMHWYPAEKKGYSGTALLSRVEFIDVTRGLGVKKHDNEGRVLTAELPDYYLVTVYTPNSQRGLARLDYRTKEWDKAFARYLKKLEKTKPVVFCGDLNVAHEEIDLARPKDNHRNAGFTDEERSTFDKLLKSGFIDTFREFTTEGGHYTWWSNFGRARDRNIGWRIDYFCISKALRPRLKEATIMPEVMGSDHCPIVMVIE
ncbi:MAG: exodeoxyribonuclease III [Deltaproteobacteria bacterium]|nr:exodeoxyribonuclease III [Deltaproteobacteria bacterium]